jgi:hypothetical protein
MVVRPARLGALLQSVKDTPGTWQDRVPVGCSPVRRRVAPHAQGLLQC